jgi:exodeoxyribonuclease X
VSDWSDLLIRAVDVETSGMPTDEDPHAVCEVGFCDLRGDEVGHPVGFLCNPGRRITTEAMAVHHITDDDVIGTCPAADMVAALLGGPPDLLVAHNCHFEQWYLKTDTIPWVCTYRVALRLWPDAESHSLQFLRYHLKLPVDRALAMPPHRAGPDAYVCAALMQRIIQEERASLEDMVRWSKGAPLLHRVSFGMHRGKLWKDLPTGYLDWIVNKSDLDADTRANARHRLKERGAA